MLSRDTIVGVLAWTVLATACGPSKPVNDVNLDSLADYQRARKASETGDFQAAAVFYNRVLRAAPEAARAHLELGLLYDEKLGEPMAALYHYRQYLELEPASPRRPVVEGYMERVKMAFAAGLTEPVPFDAGQLTRLQNENAALRARIAELERPATVATATETVEATSRTHVVQKGDTLQSLALRYYGTRSGWEKIYAANRMILPSKDQLKVGQQLVIP